MPPEIFPSSSCASPPVPLPRSDHLKIHTSPLPAGQMVGNPKVGYNGVLGSMHERSSWISVTQACPNNLCQLRGSGQNQGPTGVQNLAILRVFRVSHWCKGNRINGT